MESDTVNHQARARGIARWPLSYGQTLVLAVGIALFVVIAAFWHQVSSYTVQMDSDTEAVVAKATPSERVGYRQVLRCRTEATLMRPYDDCAQKLDPQREADGLALEDRVRAAMNDTPRPLLVDLLVWIH